MILQHNIKKKWVPEVGPVLSADDWMFVGHHILTSLYMMSARWVKAGHMSAMILMLNGEFSAPIMNINFFLEKALKQDCWKDIAWLPAKEILFSFSWILTSDIL